MGIEAHRILERRLSVEGEARRVFRANEQRREHVRGVLVVVDDEDA